MFCHKTNRIRIINSILVFNMDINSQILDITQYRSSLKNFDHKEDPVNFGHEYLKWAVLLLLLHFPIFYRLQKLSKNCQFGCSKYRRTKSRISSLEPRKEPASFGQIFLINPWSGSRRTRRRDELTLAHVWCFRLKMTRAKTYKSDVFFPTPTLATDFSESVCLSKLPLIFKI